MVKDTYVSFVIEFSSYDWVFFKWKSSKFFKVQFKTWLDAGGMVLSQMSCSINLLFSYIMSYIVSYILKVVLWSKWLAIMDGAMTLLWLIIKFLDDAHQHRFHYWYIENYRYYQPRDQNAYVYFKIKIEKS